MGYLLLFDIANIRHQSEYARNIFTENRNSLINPNEIKGLQVKKSLHQGKNCTTATQQQAQQQGKSGKEVGQGGKKWEGNREGNREDIRKEIGKILGRGLSLS